MYNVKPYNNLMKIITYIKGYEGLPLQEVNLGAHLIHSVSRPNTKIKPSTCCDLQDYSKFPRQHVLEQWKRTTALCLMDVIGQHLTQRAGLNMP